MSFPYELDIMFGSSKATASGGLSTITFASTGGGGGEPDPDPVPEITTFRSSIIETSNTYSYDSSTETYTFSNKKNTRIDIEFPEWDSLSDTLKSSFSSYGLNFEAIRRTGTGDPSLIQFVVKCGLDIDAEYIILYNPGDIADLDLDTVTSSLVECSTYLYKKSGSSYEPVTPITIKTYIEQDSEFVLNTDDTYVPIFDENHSDYVEIRFGEIVPITYFYKSSNFDASVDGNTVSVFYKIGVDDTSNTDLLDTIATSTFQVYSIGMVEIVHEEEPYGHIGLYSSDGNLVIKSTGSWDGDPVSGIVGVRLYYADSGNAVDITESIEPSIQEDFERLDIEEL